MGKSLYIKRHREALKAATTHGPREVIVPIHGPVVTADTVVGALKLSTLESLAPSYSTWTLLLM